MSRKPSPQKKKCPPPIRSDAVDPAEFRAFMERVTTRLDDILAYTEHLLDTVLQDEPEECSAEEEPLKE